MLRLSQAEVAAPPLLLLQQRMYPARIEIEKIKQIVRTRDIAVSGDKIRIALDRLIQRLQRGQQCSPDVICYRDSCHDLLRVRYSSNATKS